MCSYYNSHSYAGDEVREHFWVDLDHLPANIIKESKLLSSAHRQAFVSHTLSHFFFII